VGKGGKGREIVGFGGVERDCLGEGLSDIAIQKMAQSSVWGLGVAPKWHKFTEDGTAFKTRLN
jgi:hypothetical protein